MKLYGFDTINTAKVLMFLFENNVKFEYVPINIRAGEQHKHEFLALNPAGKVPVLFDGEQYRSESNAILFSLAQRTGWGLTDDPNMHDQLLAWLFYQASTQGPHFGQIEHWSQFAKVSNPKALARHRNIAIQEIRYLDNHLKDKKYICGEAYSIADIALFPWLHIHDKLDFSLENSKHLLGWLARIRRRTGTVNALTFFGDCSIFDVRD